MVLGAGIVGVLRLDQAGVIVIGELPRSLPPFSNLPILDFELIGQISTGALAVGAISLVAFCNGHQVRLDAAPLM